MCVSLGVFLWDTQYVLQHNSNNLNSFGFCSVKSNTLYISSISAYFWMNFNIKTKKDLWKGHNKNKDLEGRSFQRNCTCKGTVKKHVQE